MELIENLMQGSQFYTAIAACLESSQYIWNVKLQKNLVQAAQFGRVWCSSITIRDNLVSTCQRLRVMNALRAIGIPCTLSLYNKLGLPGLIDLLLAARQHGIAYQIAKTFHLSATNIVFHWAKLKITLTKDYDVDSLVATLNERLSLNKTNINHAELAKTAYASGHLLLATKLLNFETRPQEQIPLLLEMNQSELALEKAVDSLDSDLTFLVLIFLRKKLKLNEFFTVIKSCPRSIPYLIHYGKENDRSLLRDFYFLDDQHAAMGDLLMEDVVSAKNVEEKIALLRDAITCFSRSKLCLSQQKAAEQYLELLHQQAILKTQFPNCIEIGEPLCQTIFHLIEHGHLESAIKLKNSFHVSENRFSWIAIRAYINVRRLNDLDAYVHRSKRPPLCGFQAIVQELIHSKLFEEAKKYVAKCELHSRIPFYLQMNYLTDAAQICFQSGDLNGLTEIRMKAEDPLTIQQIDQLMEELKSKR
ncbi:hypothetical protein HMI54_014083 [Coelomomyces lativittatus]|nr:hypothetical protein HMI54_014083 [Coelomomyces lativittatus]